MGNALVLVFGVAAVCVIVVAVRASRRDRRSFLQKRMQRRLWPELQPTATAEDLLAPYRLAGGPPPAPLRMPGPPPGHTLFGPPKG